MADEALYTDPALARFYDLDNDWTEDRTYCLHLARGRTSVLDLGCGTGDLAIRIVQETGARVTGVDPATAMLDRARAKPGAAAVCWYEGRAETLELGRRFELIVMTGHAFQTLLTPQARAAAIAAITRHLAPGGLFVFDSRNPAMREWEAWGADGSRRRFKDPQFGPIEAWDEAAWDETTGIVTYATSYRVLVDGRVFRATARIVFPLLTELQRMIADAGLALDSVLGDWTGAPCHALSPEFIPVCRPA